MLLPSIPCGHFFDNTGILSNNNSGNILKICQVDNCQLLIAFKVGLLCCFCQGFYLERFGSDSLVMIKDSNTVERDKLNPDKVL